MQQADSKQASGKQEEAGPGSSRQHQAATRRAGSRQAAGSQQAGSKQPGTATMSGGGEHRHHAPLPCSATISGGGDPSFALLGTATRSHSARMASVPNSFRKQKDSLKNLRKPIRKLTHRPFSFANWPTDPPSSFHMRSGVTEPRSSDRKRRHKSHKNESNHKQRVGNLAAVRLRVLPNERHLLPAVGLRLPPGWKTVGPRKSTRRRSPDFE